MLRRRQGKDDANGSGNDTASTTASVSSAPPFTDKTKDPTIKKTTAEIENETTSTQTPDLVRKQYTEQRVKHRNFVLFFLGGFLGILGALFFAQQKQVVKFDSLAELNLDSFRDVLPNGFVKDMKKFSVFYISLSSSYYFFFFFFFFWMEIPKLTNV